MLSKKEKGLYLRFPWAKLVIPIFSEEENEIYTYEQESLQLNERQFLLIEKCFTEVEEWHQFRNLTVEIAIYEILGNGGCIRINLLSKYPDIYKIVEKYEGLSQEDG